MKHSIPATLRTAIAVATLAFGMALTPAHAASGVNQTLLRATSPFEDMVEQALARNPAGVKTALDAADRSATSVKGVLSASAAGQFDQRLQSIHQAARQEAYPNVAANAVEIFRLLIDNLQADTLREPREVSLLDYAGFKLHVLAAADKPDWGAMRKTAAEAAGWWTAIKPKVSDAKLRDAVNTTIRGLESASKEQHLPMLKFAAQVDLDLVDLLESHFRNKP